MQRIDIEGEALGSYLMIMEKELSAEELRATAIITFTPLHSYLFSSKGQQLYASATATLKQTRQGALMMLPGWPSMR